MESCRVAADRVTKFCYGADHLVLLKTGSIQPISSNDSLSATYPLLQRLSLETPFIDIAFGTNHGVALDANHRVFTFGDNTFGQLGIGCIGNDHGADGSIEPQQVHYFQKVKQSIIAVACGSTHCLALSASGDVYSWGDGRCGQLGTDVLSLQMLPRSIAHLPAARSIACGPECSAAVSRTGSLYQWGDRTPIPSALDLDAADSLKIRKVAIGAAHRLCVTERGQLMGWGLSAHCQLGTAAAAAKRVPSPSALSEFDGLCVADIECFGLCSVVQVESGGLHVMGSNDALFGGGEAVHRQLFDQHTVARFGCSRRDFAVVTASTTSSVAPSICAAKGTELEIAGHGIYRTPHRPMVRFEAESTVRTEEARFVESAAGALCLAVSSPDLSAHSASFPLAVRIAVAPDGRHFSDALDCWAVAAPDSEQRFEIAPQCGDAEGGTQCTVSSPTQYISRVSALAAGNLKDIRLRFVGCDGAEHTVRGEAVSVGDDGDGDGDGAVIRCTTPSMARGLYRVQLAMDGQRFAAIPCAFAVHRVRCSRCTPKTIDLSKWPQGGDSDAERHRMLALELKVSGFGAADPERLRLRVVAEGQPTATVITECRYESQSARDIAAEELATKKEFARRLEECRRGETEELEAAEEAAAAEDEDRAQRVRAMEGAKKKKKGADLAAAADEMEREAERWADTLSARQRARREVTRKFKTRRMRIEGEEAAARRTRRSESDPDGDGFILCEIDTAALAEWAQPSALRLALAVDADGAQFADLWRIVSIRPRVRTMSPRLGVLSESTAVRMCCDGFEVGAAQRSDFEVAVRDTPDAEERGIESFELCADGAADAVTVAVTVPPAEPPVGGERFIVLKYREEFQIEAAFWSHDAVKISAVSPKECAATDSEATISVSISGEIEKRFVDRCWLRISANGETVELKAALSADGGGIEALLDAEQNSLALLGAAKKAQIEVSLNGQQWVAAKQTLALK